jgi:signal transduction histidine kinase
LFASALRLQQSESVDDQLVERILSDLDAALTKLAETDLERPDLDLFLAEIKQVWGSTTSLDVIEAVPVRVELDRDSTATQCVVEVIREGVNNAIKHGEASEIIVEFDRPEAGIVQVCVVNNGRVLTGLANGGYGSTVLNDMTHDWTIRAVNGKTVLTARVALDPNTKVEETKE